jgi:hypothetical protein
MNEEFKTPERKWFEPVTYEEPVYESVQDEAKCRICNFSVKIEATNTEDWSTKMKKVEKSKQIVIEHAKKEHSIIDLFEQMEIEDYDRDYDYYADNSLEYYICEITSHREKTTRTKTKTLEPKIPKDVLIPVIIMEALMILLALAAFLEYGV